MTLLYVLYALIGISVIIFIHELGHFLAAKRVGVRVERFCVGFDPPVRGRNLRVFSFRRGETEYALGLIPFGGYVKMAGETDTDPEKTGANDELMSKSVGARALVFVAGAAMNILSALFFFMLAFSIGVRFVEPELGAVFVGDPAWKAGLQPGDKVVAIDGKPVIEFTELMVAVALGSASEPLDVTVERHNLPDQPGGSSPGPATTLTRTLRPQWSPARGFNAIGVMQATDNVLDEIDPNGAAARAGLQKGDEIVGLRTDGIELPPLHADHLLRAVGDLSAFRTGEPFELGIRRGEELLWLPVTPQRGQDQKLLPQIGVVAGAGNVVRALRPGSAAADFLKQRDRILEIGAEPVASVHWLRIQDALVKSIHDGADGQIRLLVQEFDSDNPREVRLDGRAFLRWYLGGEIYFSRHALQVDPQAPTDELAGTNLQSGDVLLELDGEPVYTPVDLEKALLRPGERGSILVERAGARVPLDASTQALQGLSEASWNTFPAIAAVTRNGPAEQAGLGPGVAILEVGGTRMRNWGNLIEKMQATEPGARIPLRWRSIDGHERQSEVTVGLYPSEHLLPLRPKQTVIRSDVLGSIALGARRTVVVSKWVFLTLRSLFRREVSAKNLQGPIGIAHVLTKVSEQGLGTMIYFLAIISVNLGLFNLLPFPILDGGHLFFLLIEKVKGSPVDIRVQEWATNVAFLLIISLAVFVTFNDLTRLLN